MMNQGLLSGQKVLIIEDEALIALDIRLSVEEADGHVCGISKSNAAAKCDIDLHNPTCAIVDVRLIDGDANQLINVLLDRNIPFVFHSGHGHNTQIVQQNPDVPFLKKPARHETLIQELAKLLSTDL